MKAKVIATGEIIDFKGSSINFGTATWIDSNNILHQESIPKGGIELLENTEPIDWEQRRYEIAKDAMAAFISSPSYQFFVNNNYYDASHSRPWSAASSSQSESVKTLRVSDIPSSRLLYRLVPSARHTDGIEFGLLPTPRAKDGSHGGGR